MTAVVDNLIAARIIYLLVLPFTKWPAYDQGIIDENGERTDKDEKSDDWSMLHRLVARLKKLLSSFPGGRSTIASVAAAYLLVKENVECDKEITEVELKNIQVSFENFHFVRSTIVSLEEEGVVVGTGLIAGAGPNEDPPVRKPSKYKKKVMKRNANPIVP